MPHFSPLLQRVAAEFAAHPQVVAIALAGSQTTGHASSNSDFDVYIYTRNELTPEQRLVIGKALSPSAQLVDYWGPGMEWDDAQSGAHIDAVFFGADWMEAQIDKVLTRCEASLGYSTCFWHTVTVSRVLYDPTGWFDQLQRKAAAPYPEQLAQRIVALNMPVLRASFSSYRRQIEKALARRDIVSVNHRIAAFLASVFDIIFAVNRMPHPGEKRLIDIVETRCALRPEGLRQHVTVLLGASALATASDAAEVLNALDALVDALERLS